MTSQTRHRLTTIGIGLAATLVVLAFGLLPWTRDFFETLEVKAYDVRIGLRKPLDFHVDGPDGQPLVPITHIDINDDALRQVGRWPWPRERQAELIDGLTALGARSIVYDVIFPDPSQKVVEQSRFEHSQNFIKGKFDVLRGTELLPVFWQSAAKLVSGSELIAEGKLDEGMLKEELKSAVGKVEDAYRVAVNSIEEDVQTQIDDFIKDHDSIMGVAVERSGRVVLAFHFNLAVGMLEDLRPRYPEVKAIFDAEPGIPEPRLAEKLGLPYSRIKGLGDALRKAIYLDHAGIREKLDAIYLQHPNLDVPRRTVTDAIGLSEAHLGSLIQVLPQESVVRIVDKVLDRVENPTLEDCFAVFRQGNMDALDRPGNGSGESGEAQEPRTLSPIMDQYIRETFVKRLALKIVRTKHSLRLPVPRNGGRLLEGTSLEPPVLAITRHAEAIGYVTIQPDPLDGVIRRVPLFVAYADVDGRRLAEIPEDQPVSLYPQVGLLATLEYLGVGRDQIEVVPGSHVLLRNASWPWQRADAEGKAVETPEDARFDIRIPIDEVGRALINWAGARGARLQNLFEHVGAGDIMSIAVMRQNIRSNRQEVLQRLFQRRGQALRALKAGSMEEVAPTLSGILAKYEDIDWSRAFTMLAGREDEVDALAQRYLDDLRETADKVPPRLRESTLAKGRNVQITLSRIEGLKTEVAPLVEGFRSKVQGRICLIGDTSTSSADIKPIPMASEYPGVGIHSHLMNMVFQRDFLRRASPWTNGVALLLAGAIVAVLATFGTSGLNAAWAVLGAAVYFGVSLWIFNEQGIWLDAAAPAIAMGFAFASVTVFRQLTEEREKRKIRHAFSIYMSPAVVEDVTRNPEKLVLGGERKELSVYFSDVAGFTSISEAMKPEDLVHLLNEYLGDMTDIIMNSGGTLDKYIGDAIMAFWGAPLDIEDHAVKACQAALDCQTRLAVLRKDLINRGYPELIARAGINSGGMVVGNMGSATRFNYTVMGDAVNLAARLEPANKNYDTNLIISEFSYELAKETIEARDLDLLQVKGKEKPVKVYELMAKKGGLDEDRRQLVARYLEGLRLYRKRQWDEALAALHQALELDPHDGPSAAYVKRCKEFKANPPPPDWDGVYVMKTK